MSERSNAKTARPRPGRLLPVLDASLHDPAPVSPGTSVRAERRDAAENRRQILAAAARLFAERGVDPVCMDEIAREAGVGKGTLYRRFAHKGELCEALLDASARRFQEETLAVVGRGAEVAPALDLLDRFLTRLVAFNEENAPLLSAVRDAAFGERRHAVYHSPAYAWQRLTVAALLRRAVAAGECPPLDVEYLADAVLAPLDIDLYLYQRHGLGFGPERIAAGLRRLAPGGLRRAE
ncbi:MAG: TetR/AcrR family transcriptional regulator [Chloroflexota bacterium]|nr:TetR/AcrR family transcriptional regulator [Chloroflexota bacterium]